MRLLILGATGMIGHCLWMGLSSTHDVSVIIRRDKAELPDIPNIDSQKIFDKVDVTNFKDVETIIENVKPDVVFNCIGIVKQLELSKSYLHSIELNSLFPHRLAKVCLDNNSRMIQFSSDCVFDGEKGLYVESDIPNAVDLYGKSKALGEIDYMSNVLTLRTSFIGREIFPHGGLINWFESQKGKVVKGYSQAIYSGLPAASFINILNTYILPNRGLHGIYHLSNEPIDKYSLLILVKNVLKLNVEIIADDSFVIDRSLDSSKFKNELGCVIPQWNEIIGDLLIQNSFYDAL